MKYQRLIIFFTPLIVWLLSQAILITPKFFYSALALGAAVIIFSVKFLADAKALKNWPVWFVSPLLFWLAGAVYAAILPGRFWVQAIFLMILFFLFFYFRHLYYHFAYGAPEREEKLEGWLLSGGFLTVFASSATLFGLSAFINWPFVLLFLSFIIISAVLILPFTALRKISLKKNGWLVLVSLITFGELVWAISLLPLNFNVLAFLAAIFYYFILMIIRLDWRGELKRQTLKWPVILSFVLVLISLLTARWL